MIYAAVVAAILCSLLTGLLRRWLIERQVIDVPGERSSHSAEKPRGGGIAFVAGISALLGFAFYQGSIDLALLLALCLPGLMIAAIGFIDDLRSLPLQPRLLTQLVAAAVALALIPLPPITLGAATLQQPLLLFPLYLLASVWFINLYNFMDGIDGIASLEAISMLTSAALILALAGDSVWASLLFALAAPVAGFLVWNFPRSKIFMGDVGSAYLGFVLAALALCSAALTELNVWTWLILAALFVVDSTYTLLERMRSGQRWTQPHRLHAYQVLSRRLNSHPRVNLILLAINLAYLLPLAWYATAAPERGWLLALAAYLPFVFACRLVGAGKRCSDAAAATPESQNVIDKSE